MDHQRRHAGEAADRNALIVTFLIGAGGAMALKLLLPDGLAAPLSALWAGSSLIAYAIAAQMSGRLRIEPEAIGDNCYYLGFLFTLTSLAVSLYSISGTGSGTDFVRDVIAGFGIALASTIVGIGLRLYLMRMRPDIAARDIEARIEIHDAMRRFRTNLTDGAAMFSSFTTESVQLMAEERDRMRGLGDRLMESHEAAMRRGAEIHMSALKETIEAGAREASEAIAKAVSTSLDRSNRQIEEGVTAMRNDLAAFLEAELKALQKLIATAGTVTEGSAASMQSVEAAARRLDALGANLDAAAVKTRTTLTVASERMAEVIELSSAASVQSVELTAKRLEALAARLDKAAVTTEATLTSSSSRMADAVDKGAERVEKSLSALAAAGDFAPAADGLAAAAKALDAPVEALDRAASRLIDLADRIEARATAEATKAFASRPASPDGEAEPAAPPNGRDGQPPDGPRRAAYFWQR